MPAWLLATLIALHPVEEAPEKVHASAAGKDLIVKFECNRCHKLPDIEPPSEGKQCVGCHVEIEAGRFEAPRRILRRWQKNIVHLIEVPSMFSVGERFRRDWLKGFLAKPHRLRANLKESMPRLPFTESQLDVISAHFIPSEARADSFEDADMSRGRELLDTRGCGTCHTFSGVPAIRISSPSLKRGDERLAVGMRLGPDLRHTRDRFQSGRLVEWIRDPKSMKSDTAMPSEGLSRAEARDIAGYIMKTPLAAPVSYVVPERLPVLRRRVRFREVERVILHKTCWHCHSDPDYARGDGGPGNSGGFGFEARGINLADYAGVASGHLSREGKRKSLFTKTKHDDMPLLVASLWARHHEVAGNEWADVRGMPLGLPPLPPKEIQLIETWIDQGRAE